MKKEEKNVTTDENNDIIFISRANRRHRHHHRHRQATLCLKGPFYI